MPEPTAAAPADCYFTLVTVHGGTVVADGDAATIVGAAPGPAPGTAGPRANVIFYRSLARPDAGVLASNTLVPLALTMVPYRPATLIPLRLTHPAAGGTVSLFHPGNGRWLCGTPHSDDVPGTVHGDAQLVQAFERFGLRPVRPIMVMPTVLAMAAHVEWLLGPDFSPAALADRLAAEGFPAALEAASQLWPTARIAALLEAMIADPALARSYAAAMPADPFATIALPAHLDVLRREAAAAAPAPTPRGIGRWFKARPRPPAPAPQSPASLALGPELDSLAALGADGTTTGLAHRLTLLGRERIVPDRDVCILATARNEGLYVLDWVAYHRAIGIGDIFLYTNDNDDGSDALLAALSAAGVIRWRDSSVARGGNAQSKAYGHGLQFSPELLRYRWVLVIDLDEFLGFDTTLFPDLASFIDWHETREVDAIGLNWVMHGSARQGRWRDEFLPRRFPVAPEGANLHLKTLFRPHRFMHSGPHVPVAAKETARLFRTASGLVHTGNVETGLFALSAVANADKAWISHFFYRSTEEYLLKWSRNRGDYPTQAGPTTNSLTPDFVRWFMGQFDAVAPDKWSILPCAPGFDAERARLAALPGVSEAFEAIKARHRARMPAVEAAFHEAQGVRDAGEAGQAMMATLG